MFVDLWKAGKHIGKLVHTPEMGFVNEVRGPHAKEIEEILDEIDSDRGGYVMVGDFGRKGSQNGIQGRREVETRSPDWLAAVALLVLPQFGFRAVVDTKEVSWSD